jgi:hypothetical protein
VERVHLDVHPQRGRSRVDRRVLPVDPPHRLGVAVDGVQRVEVLEHERPDPQALGDQR